MSFGICRVDKVKTASGIAGIQIHDRRERNHSNTNPGMISAEAVVITALLMLISISMTVTMIT